MKNFNYKIFLYSTAVFILLLIPSFYVTCYRFQIGTTSNIIWLILTNLLFVLTFPSHILFRNIFREGWYSIFTLVLIINCILHALAAERIISMVNTVPNHTKLKFYHIIPAFIVYPISALIFLGSAHSSFSTFTVRPGLRGFMPYYYNVTNLQWSFNDGLTSIISFIFLLLTTLFLWKKKPTGLIILFCCFIIFLYLLNVYDDYLATRFTPKG